MNDLAPHRGGRLRIAVLQPGARLHYAVPALLQRAGLLERLYTDFANTGALRRLAKMWPATVQPAALRRLLGRRLPPNVPEAKVRQVRFGTLRQHVARMFDPQRREQGGSSDSLIELARKEKLGGANAVYTVLVNEDLEFCRELKQQGVRIIHEVMLTPDVGLLTLEEFRRHSRIDEAQLGCYIQEGRDRDRQKYALADLILVPSHFVREAVIALGADPSKVAVVPYGIDRRWLTRTSQPVRGRVLFVGSVGLRKGNHYLAEAARDMSSRQVPCEVRVVGPRENIEADPRIFAGPTYRGQVPRADIQREYATADIFVLPSLAEGMAMATLEAMAMGLPVITTPNSGSCVRDGVDGIIVPARNPRALASAIELLVRDRPLRNLMSCNAKERAAEFTWERYERRLIGALELVDARVPRLECQAR